MGDIELLTQNEAYTIEDDPILDRSQYLRNILETMVGVPGIEPGTSSMSTRRSPAELYALPEDWPGIFHRLNPMNRAASEDQSPPNDVDGRRSTILRMLLQALECDRS